MRKHFGRYPITDVKFFPHRRIGYVGYRTPEDAAKAVKYFDKTFIKLTRIYAELARPIADKELPKSRRQQKLESISSKTKDHVAPRQENELKRKRAEVEQDPKLKEFLEVYQPPSKTNIWTNGDLQQGQMVVGVDEVVPEVPVPEDESDDEYQVISKKPKVVETTAQVSDEPVTAPPATVESELVTSNIDVNAGEAMDVDQDKPAEQGAMSDADWLRSRTNRVLELVEDDEEPLATSSNLTAQVPITVTPAVSQSTPEDALDKPMAEAHATEERPVDATSLEEDKIRETGRLYLRNLHYEVTEDELREQFSKHGPLEEVHVPLSKADGKGKGFAFVQFQNHDHALEAYLDNDNTIFQGRLLHIISAKAKKDTKLDEFEISKLPLKKQKEIRRKQDAVRATFNWNSLYLNVCPGQLFH